MNPDTHDFDNGMHMRYDPVMKVVKTQDGKTPKEGHRRLRSIPTLPTLFTLGNLACGFAAIHFALRTVFAAGQGIDPLEELPLKSALLERLVPSFVTLACLYILLGMFCDLLDGLVARVTRRTSDFGGQLDSLADVVTSGLAPAMLVVAIMMRDMRTYVGDVTPGPFGPHVLGRLVWVSALIYTLAAAIRLARFNVEHTKPDFSHKTFKGLPCPGAAGMMISLAIAQDAAQRGTMLHQMVILSFPIICIGLGALMVSRIPYVRLDRSFLQRRQPFERILLLLVLLVIFVTFKELTLVMLGLGYVLSGPVTWVLRKFRGTPATNLEGEPHSTSSQPSKLG